MYAQLDKLSHWGALDSWGENFSCTIASQIASHLYHPMRLSTRSVSVIGLIFSLEVDFFRLISRDFNK